MSKIKRFDFVRDVGFMTDDNGEWVTYISVKEKLEKYETALEEIYTGEPYEKNYRQPWFVAEEALKNE